MIDDVPIVEDLTRSGAIGVAGKSQGVAGVARGLLSQIAGLHSPAELTIAAIVSESWTPEFEYLKWLPHVDSAHSPIDGAQLANSAATAEALLAAIERLIDDRAEHARRVPAVLLLVSSDAPADYARLVRVAERGPDAAVYTLWIGPAVTDLPAVARTFIDLSDDDTAEVGFVQKGLTVAGVRTEGVSREQALVVARHLTQIVDASAEAIDSSDLPSSVRLLTLIGPEAAESADFIVNRWRLNESINARDGETRTMRAGRLRAIVGRSGADPMQLDLRAQGPHALVVGTTGSGKSEFLKTWVLSMA
ncbi:MAG: FtsK/SpoIIIE domain-containing protein, partial [Actinomycetota bacterium]